MKIEENPEEQRLCKVIIFNCDFCLYYMVGPKSNENECLTLYVTNIASLLLGPIS